MSGDDAATKSFAGLMFEGETRRILLVPLHIEGDSRGNFDTEFAPFDRSFRGQFHIVNAVYQRFLGLSTGF
ncbi:MAG: hypothetical protein ACO3U5_04135, partial [Aquiluna sp.]